MIGPPFPRVIHQSRERERERERGHYKALQRVLLTSVSNPRAALENKIQNSARHRFVKLSVKSIALTFPPLFPLETPSPPLPENKSISVPREGGTVGRNCWPKLLFERVTMEINGPGKISLLEPTLFISRFIS